CSSHETREAFQSERFALKAARFPYRFLVCFACFFLQRFERCGISATEYRFQFLFRAVREVFIEEKVTAVEVCREWLIKRKPAKESRLARPAGYPARSRKNILFPKALELPFGCIKFRFGVVVHTLRTTPFSASTSTMSPLSNAFVAILVPITHGFLSS